MARFAVRQTAPMITPVGEQGWRLRSAGGGQTWGTYKQITFAIAPECPDVAHGTRDCRCGAFKRRALALAYIKQHDDSVS